MIRIILSLVLLACCLGMMAVPAQAQGRVVVYFDAAGTVRSKDSPGVGQLDALYIYGENFPSAFISGIQYQIDYGSAMTWFADAGLPVAVVGNSRDGIAMGFGTNPRPGAKFLIQIAVVEWTSDCTAQNADIRVLDHPFLEGGIVATRFPDFSTLPATGHRAQACQMVEFDIKPGSCPNPLNVNVWQKPGSPAVLPVAILGSPTVDVTDIDPSTVRLNGVAPIRWSFEDVGNVDGDNDCDCDGPQDSDGLTDLTLKFSRYDIALAIDAVAPPVGTEIPLALTGAYDDGMPFEGVDCITIVGKGGPKGGGKNSAGPGYPNPNPFNPVTRISYTLPGTQHVRLAVYDVAGRLVQELVNEVKGAGEHVVEWNAGRLPSGVYFYRFQAGGETFVRRATLLK
jgi:hypothetical protein